MWIKTISCSEQNKSEPEQLVRSFALKVQKHEKKKKIIKKLHYKKTVSQE